MQDEGGDSRAEPPPSDPSGSIFDDHLNPVSNIIGQKLKFGDNFTIEFVSLLGVGASGAVYKCLRQSNTGGMKETLAAKVIDLRQMYLLPEWEREKEKMKREVSILASICHQGIVNLQGVIDLTDYLILLMDLVEQGELFNRIAKHTLNEEQARYVFTQVAHTLMFLHSQGIIHRDLKLENILISNEPAPGYFHVKVADFGLSKFVAGNISRARSYVGTPQYWAPEVILAGRRHTSYTYSADIWSLGCTLYIMLAGVYPFNRNSESDDQVLTRGRISFNLPALDTISEDCKTLIRGMLLVNTEERFGFKEIFNSEWMKKPFAPTTPPLPLWKPIKRHPINMNLGPLFSGARLTDQLSHIFVKNDSASTNQTTTDNRPAGQILPCDNQVNETNAKEIHPVRNDVVVRRNYADDVLDLFNGANILHLLISVFYKFRQAILYFKDSHTIITSIESLLQEIRGLTLATLKVFRAIRSTCKCVGELLDDVCAAVEDKEAAAAVDMVDNLQSWVKDVIEEATHLKDRYTEVNQRAHGLVTRARNMRPHPESPESSPRVEAGYEMSATPETREVDIDPSQFATSADQSTPPGSLTRRPSVSVVDKYVDDNIVYCTRRENIMKQVEKAEDPELNCEPGELTREVFDMLFVGPDLTLNKTSQENSSSTQPPSTAKSYAQMASAIQAIPCSDAETEHMGLQNADAPQKPDATGALFQQPDVSLELPDKEEESGNSRDPPKGEVKTYDIVPAANTPQRSANGTNPGGILPDFITMARCINPSPFWLRLDLLLRGLQEILQICHILEQCSIFWDNLDLTLGMVRRFRDQIVILLKSSVKTGGSQLKRLINRIDDYKQFWIALGEQCSVFIDGCVKSEAEMRAFFLFWAISMKPKNAP